MDSKTSHAGGFQGGTNAPTMKRALLLFLCLFGWLLVLPAWSEPDPLVTPDSRPVEPHQSVADPFGGGIALYRMLPENRLQVVDFEKQSSNEFFVSQEEVLQLQDAYLKASEQVAKLADKEEVEEVTVKLRTHEVAFVPIKKDGRGWVVLNVLGLGQDRYRTFMAVPQTWAENDPERDQLAAIKASFESLLVKSGL